MENQEAMRFLHKHYVAWLQQGQWEPWLSMPEGSYPNQGEWIRMEWQFSQALVQEHWQEAERIVENCFRNICDVWVVCHGEKVSALGMAKTLSTPSVLSCLWVAATDAAESLQQTCDTAVVSWLGEPCQSYGALVTVALCELNVWWTQRCAMPPQERREHRKRIQNYLKKSQYGHISGYVARGIRRSDQQEISFWFWIPLVMESLWLQNSPPMSLLLKYFHADRLMLEGEEAFLTWLRKTCAELKRMAKPEDPIQRVTDSIQKDCSLPYSQTNLAEGLGLTSSYFSRLFEKHTGVRFTEYLTHVRITRAQELLTGSASLSEITQACGFQRKSYFCDVFHKHTGMTAMQYRDLMKKDDVQ